MGDIMREKLHYAPLDLYLDNLTPIVVIDSSGVIKWCNQNIGLVGVSFNELAPDTNLNELCHTKTKAQINIDGVPYLIDLFPSPDKRETTLVLTNDTITNRRLNFYIKNWDILLNNPYEGIIFIDENGIIRYVNDALAHYNNVTKDRIIGLAHKDFPIDENLDRILATQEFEPFAFFTTAGNKRMIASRGPVYRKGLFAGAFGRYLSVDPRDVVKFGESYIDLIGRLDTRDIMVNVSQSLLELNSYKHEFEQANKVRLGVDNIIGNSPSMKDLKNRILMIADSPSSILLTGESGTGKELFAKAVHFHGKRSSQPFIKVNCAAIPENLLEAELFGYVEGAFTGARKGGKMGKFELANKGTMFLDEIGDMPSSMQAKLLRVLQEREIERLGSDRTIPIDVRIVSATNKDLLSLVEEGTFREDLYYRINVLNLHIPPLRERKTDIPNLVSYIIDILNKKLDRSVLYPTQEVMDLFMIYNWPGNIRELINILETAMNFCGSSIIDIKDLPLSLHVLRNSGPNEDNKQSLEHKIDSTEKYHLMSVLQQCNGSRKATAEILNISKSTLFRLMKKHDLM
jgi:transcriptional regulator with PAS, ATPase and Fis domain